ncbi:PAS domain S-box protein [Neobacillus citreus]|uniref:histidine kinase n=1 Tax=Neobacillus citreus TaxID=2833578 RepID=A0A942YB31_9BACI|nr:PAS domain S-box protein [Neobacillus citreus]MCH6268215.1 PAS domain S-box protein [Neobacillus citreus]
MKVMSIAALFDEHMGMNEALGKLVESPELTIWYRDLAKDTLWVSKGNAAIYGYTQDDFMNNPTLWQKAVYQDDRWILDDAIARQLEGSPTTVEYRIIRSDGEVIWIENRSHSILDSNGKVIAISGSTYDITEQKRESLQLQEQLIMNEKRYKSLFNYNHDLVCSLDLNGKVTSVNKSCEALTGYSETELMSKFFKDWVYEADLPKTYRAYKLAKNGHSERMELRIVHKSGDILFTSTTTIPIMIDDKMVGVYCIVKDITKHKKLQEELEGNNLRYKSLFEHNANCVYSFDLHGYFTSCNSVCEQLTGDRKEELLKPVSFHSFIVPEKLPDTIYHFEQCKKGTPQNFRTSIKNRKGSIIHLNVTIVPLIVNGQINGVFGIAQDITKQVKIEETNEHMAYHDYLTGLPNRNKLNTTLSKELALAQNRSQQVAILFLDLDRFKLINDTLGHTTGDQLLKEVAERMKSSLYDKDIVFRQGGDEFIIILKNADRDVASIVSRRILDILSEPFQIENYDIFTSPSIGISMYPEDGENVEILIKKADFAMYHAKNDGKNNFKFYSQKERKSNMNPLKIEMDLHKALEKEELLLHYQPKVNLKTGKITGVEALIRWNHSEFGMIAPGTFIPIAEETGLITPIGEWALYTACKQCKDWQRKGFSTTVSVNLSARQFTQSNLHETVAIVLYETELEPRFLELEITESMTASIERTIYTLQKLKKLGVRISIDDFGKGFSSLNYLQKFPVDTLKIDQAFVQSLHKNPNDETIVKTIISMAHNLNLSVVAEGIETKEQLLFLQQHLCDEGQGYFFTKPVPAEEVENNWFDIQQMVKEFGLSQDVNERKWAEEFVRIARKELNETIRLQQGMTFKYKKINGRFIHTLCDGELLYRLGLIPSLVVGKSLAEFLPKEYAEDKEVYYQRAWDGEEHVSYEGEVNGVTYLAALSPIKRGGEVVEVIASCVDITERRKVEKALHDSENKYRLITENMTDLITLFNQDGTCVYATPSHQTVLGYTPEFFIGHNNEHLTHPEDAPLMKKTFVEVLETKTPCKVELRLLHANGDWRLLECTGTPVIGENGEVEHIMVASNDITEKRRAEELLSKSEKLSLVGELAAGVAHEIRNPMTSIKGFIQLFQQGIIRDEYFDVVLGEFDRVEDIIKEFLSLARPQEIQLKQVNIPVLLKEVETLIKSEAHLKDVEILLEIEPDLPAIMCDTNQIKQVLLNLCKNSMDALDTKRKGLIKITVGVECDQLLLQVIDNGIGISEERIKRLGEPFYSNKEKGTGLGLMICFRIIKQHNGTITFQSKGNCGTTAQVRLPL